MTINSTQCAHDSRATRLERESRGGRWVGAHEVPSSFLRFARASRSSAARRSASSFACATAARRRRTCEGGRGGRCPATRQSRLRRTRAAVLRPGTLALSRRPAGAGLRAFCVATPPCAVRGRNVNSCHGGRARARGAMAAGAPARPLRSQHVVSLAALRQHLLRTHLRRQADIRDRSVTALCRVRYDMTSCWHATLAWPLR